MAYQIRYGTKSPQVQAAEQAPVLWIGLGLLCAVLVMCLFWPETAQTTRQLLFPWTAPETEAAFEGMLEQIWNGQDLQEAITVFCREVLSYAGIWT